MPMELSPIPRTAGEKIKVALVGLGSMGKHHFRAVQRSKHFRLTAVVDALNKEGESGLLKEEGVPTFQNLQDLGHVDFDCAIVATPTPTHFKLSQELLRREKHLLIEKPITLDAGEAATLGKIAEERRCLAVVGHIERCNPAIVKMLEIVQSGRIGAPRHLTTLRAGGWPRKASKENNVLFDLGVHDFDLATRFDENLSVVASSYQCNRQPGVCDIADVLLQNPTTGLMASVHVNWLSPTPRRAMTMLGTRGLVKVDCVRQRCHVIDFPVPSKQDGRAAACATGNDGVGEEIPILAHDQLDYQLLELNKALTGSQHILSTPKEAAKAVKFAQDAMTKGAFRHGK